MSKTTPENPKPAKSLPQSSWKKLPLMVVGGIVLVAALSGIFFKSLMLWFLSASPYILAGGTILTCVITLLKEWEEYKSKGMRMAAILLLTIVGVLTFVTLHRDNQEKESKEKEVVQLSREIQAANDRLRDGNEQLGKIRKSQETAEGQAKDAKKKQDAAVTLAEGLNLELGIVRHELNLERTPVIHGRFSWLLAIPNDAPCLKALTELARANSEPEEGIAGVNTTGPTKRWVFKLGEIRFPSDCQDPLRFMFQDLQLNVLFCKPCGKAPWFDPNMYLFGGEGGVQKTRFFGSLPEGFWMFAVSGNALSPPNTEILFDEDEAKFHLRFHSDLRDDDLRMPTGKRLSIYDVSEGTFFFEPALYGFSQPFVKPELQSVEVQLNQWVFEFVAPSHDVLPLMSDRRRLFQAITTHPSSNLYVGRVPKFRKSE